MNWFKKHGTNILLVLALLVGLGLLVYPSFADYWNSFTQSRAIVSYAETVANLDTEVYEAIWNDALAYNQALSETGILWVQDEEQLAEYERQLNVTGTGNMGYIDIPKIKVSLPVYHGTTEAVLQTSIGHLTGTSLPAGGEGSHCALSGHRGLPSAKLFSDLDKLVEGDHFILTILDQTLTYEVDQIRIVEPTDVSDLVIEEGQDYCTLITCTPYGINSHRMLVRGHRVENERKTELRISADALLIDPIYVAPAIAIPVLALLILWVFIMTSGHRQRKHAKQRRDLRDSVEGKSHQSGEKDKANSKDKGDKKRKKPASKKRVAREDNADQKKRAAREDKADHKRRESADQPKKERVERRQAGHDSAHSRSKPAEWEQPLEVRRPRKKKQNLDIHF